MQSRCSINVTFDPFSCHDRWFIEGGAKGATVLRFTGEQKKQNESQIQ